MSSPGVLIGPTGQVSEGILIKGGSSCRSCRFRHKNLRVKVQDATGGHTVERQVCKWFSDERGIPENIWLGVRTCLFFGQKGKNAFTDNEEPTP